MSGALARRIAKLEPRIVPSPVPHIVVVRAGETAAEAKAVFHARHGAKLKGYYGLIVVPDRIATQEQDADFKARFLAHQTRIVAEAKSARPKEQDDG